MCERSRGTHNLLDQARATDIRTKQVYSFPKLFKKHLLKKCSLAERKNREATPVNTEEWIGMEQRREL